MYNILKMRGSCNTWSLKQLLIYSMHLRRVWFPTIKLYLNTVGRKSVILK